MKRTLIVILFLPFFLGCEKNTEEPHNLNVNQKKVDVDDGRLNLTYSSFNSLIKDMHKKQTPTD